MDAWKDFKGESWKNNIDVNDFILNNYTEYLGDDSFLCEKTEKTTKIWNKCINLFKLENKKHVLDIETKKISGITSFKPGYICKQDNVIVGLQTDKPLKLIVNLFGGVRMALKSVESYNRKLDKKILNHFKLYRKSHNDGVFDAYTNDPLQNAD